VLLFHPVSDCSEIAPEARTASFGLLMLTIMSSTKNTEHYEEATPCGLELSLNPEDGSLLTAPLSTVLLSATDGLYSDLYQMAHGEIEVAHANEDESGALLTKEKMSNLSFAQRRHELAWRLAQHAKALSHVSGLTAAAASSKDFAQSTRVSTKALQHARTAWVQADEAQDALYFFHAQLFPARQAPHDVYGALDLLQRGVWRDMSTDVELKMDPYETSNEHSWSAKEVAERWHMAVQTKLLTGEVGHMKQSSPQTLWKISLQGGIVKLTQGTPKQIGSSFKYPVEATLTVLSTAANAEWTLLSVEVEAQPKTGESSHQLDPTNRQRFDLHRLCVQAMKKEEARAKRENDESPGTATVARPLNALFQVAHTFDLSWQLEILSAQAQALRRGVWATADSSLQVTPVTFFDDGPILGIVSIAFWSVDDRYGPPRVGDLDDDTTIAKETLQSENGSTRKNAVGKDAVTNKFVLSIRAEANAGMRVSLSGGKVIMEAAKMDPIVQRTVTKLIAAASDPFALSASDVLLAATTLCGERKCHAVVQALQQLKPSILPKWMRLTVERGGIAVAAQVSYGMDVETPFVVLFRLECDARTGSFVFTFPRSANLLRMLSCNHPSASDAMTLRMTKAASHRQKGMAATATGRFVKDSFDGLARSMNLLGQRTGVGGEWVNANDADALLRQRAIQLACADVKASLTTCCGVAAVYGLSAMSLGVATGVTAVADM